MREENSIPVEERLTRLLRFCGKALHHGMGGKASQQRILAIMYRHEVMTQRELMEIIGIQSGSMSELLGKIEEKGLLIREKNARDKRNVDVRLTEAGRREAERVRQERKKLEQHLFAALSDEEKQELCALLSKVQASWEKDELICPGKRCKKRKEDGVCHE